MALTDLASQWGPPAPGLSVALCSCPDQGGRCQCLSWHWCLKSSWQQVAFTFSGWPRCPRFPGELAARCGCLLVFSGVSQVSGWNPQP